VAVQSKRVLGLQFTWGNNITVSANLCLRPPPTMVHDTLPRDARIIALLVAANPSIKDAHPAVLHQLLEFAHRMSAL
jgi:hypothetical protein